MALSWLTLTRSLATAVVSVLIVGIRSLISGVFDWSVFGFVAIIGAVLGPLMCVGQEVQAYVDRRKSKRFDGIRQECLDLLRDHAGDHDASLRAAASRKLRDIYGPTAEFA